MLHLMLRNSILLLFIVRIVMLLCHVHICNVASHYSRVCLEVLVCVSVCMFVCVSVHARVCVRVWGQLKLCAVNTMKDVTAAIIEIVMPCQSSNAA